MVLTIFVTDWLKACDWHCRIKLASSLLAYAWKTCLDAENFDYKIKKFVTTKVKY